MFDVSFSVTAADAMHPRFFSPVVLLNRLWAFGCSGDVRLTAGI